MQSGPRWNGGRTSSTAKRAWRSPLPAVVRTTIADPGERFVIGGFGPACWRTSRKGVGFYDLAPASQRVYRFLHHPRRPPQDRNSAEHRSATKPRTGYHDGWGYGR